MADTFKNLRGADLRRLLDLSDADLSGADLRGVMLPDNVPVIPNIDAAILAAIQAGGKLDRALWHKCETTHCRAGWAITLAGKAGKTLEGRVGSCVAGGLIYAASRPDKPVPNFYATNAAAMVDIVACAAEAA